MIYIITHKDFNDQLSYGENSFYAVMHVGGDTFTKNYLRDDIGDNISRKNKYFCELTGYYWLWKNAMEQADEVIGIVHYRRGFSSFLNGLMSIILRKSFVPLKKSEIDKYLEKNDFILPIKHVFSNTVYEQYSKAHVASDVDAVRNIISNIYPEYLQSFDIVFNGHTLFTGNLFVTKRDKFNKYCEWLFSILFEFEKTNNIGKYNCEYNKRVYGFLAERLLNVFLHYNSLKIKQLPAINIEKYCQNH